MIPFRRPYEDFTKIKFKRKDESIGTRFVCSDCINHKQEYEMDYLDCKNTCVDNDGREFQCCCYSKEHGVREKRY